jgi:hypothetical protein
MLGFPRAKGLGLESPPLDEKNHPAARHGAIVRLVSVASFYHCLVLVSFSEESLMEEVDGR